MFLRKCMAITVFISMCAFFISCNGTTVDTPRSNPPSTNPPPTNPPAIPSDCISQNAKATVSTPASDGSSIVITQGACAVSSSTPWKNVSALKIAPYSTAGLTCPYSNCLAALDVGPDDIQFINDDVSLLPKLSYDLNEHPVTSTVVACGSTNATDTPNDETKVAECYGIYQFVQKTPEYVGPASPVLNGGEPFAEGNIRHFSVFALVRLPPPNGQPGAQTPRTFTLVVASSFIRARSGHISVAMNVTTDPQRQFSGQRIFRFDGVEVNKEPVIKNSTKNCSARFLDRVLTCLFPKGTPVSMEISRSGTLKHVKIAVEKGTSIEFDATYVLVY